MSQDGATLNGTIPSLVALDINASSPSILIDQKEKYRQEEKEKGIRYCSIEHGCFRVCKEGFNSCDICIAYMNSHP